MFEHDDYILERVIRHLKEPTRIDPALDARVLAAISAVSERAEPWSAGARVWRWLVTPRRIALPPLAGLAVAAVLAVLLVARPWASSPDSALLPVDFQFVLVAPRAATVTLVGDFNDWDPARTPMRAASSGGLWTTVLSLAPGRYRYAFLVDGSAWLADPAAPRADDEFGPPSSVVTVGGS